MTEKRTKPDACPWCGGHSVITYDAPKFITYTCGECREQWKSYRKRPPKNDNADLLPGHEVQNNGAGLPKGRAN